MGACCSRPAGGRQQHGCCSCCGCCACCIAAPDKAVLYDEDEGHLVAIQPMGAHTAEAQQGVTLKHNSLYEQSDSSSQQDTPPMLLPQPMTGLMPGLGSLKASASPCNAPPNGNVITTPSPSMSSTPSPFMLCTNMQGPPQPTAPAGPQGFCMPSMGAGLPSFPGVVGACLSAGMNARSVRALRAHLSAKGFAVDTQQPQPSHAAGTQQPHIPSTVARTTSGRRSGRWHSMLPRPRRAHSVQPMASTGLAPATLSAPDPTSPTSLPSGAGQLGLARSSNVSWSGMVMYDACSQVNDSPRASEDWMDIMDPDDMDAQQGQGAEGLQQVAEEGPNSSGDGGEDADTAASDAGSEACAPSTSTFLSACCSPPSTLSPSSSLHRRAVARTHSAHGHVHHPHPHQQHLHHAPSHPQHRLSQQPSQGSQPAVRRSTGMSWEANVHRAQASIAQEDWALTGGQQHPALAAFKQGTLGWAFSGGGFWFPYALGAVIQLKDMGIITDRTPLAGSSCGSIITACVNSGLDLHQLVFRLLEFAADCRTYGTAGRLKSVIEKFMTANLPPDAHIRCTGKTYISITKVFPYLRPWILDQYHSKEDVVSAIATSCHIPAYNDGSLMARFRDTWCVDGGLMRHIPRLPAESGATHVAGVSCVPFKFLESLPGVTRLQLLHSLSVSPDMFGTFPFGWHEVGGLVLAPAEDPVLLQMVEMGKRDIVSWSAAVGITQHLAGMDWVPACLTVPSPQQPAPAAAAARPQLQQQQQQGVPQAVHARAQHGLNNGMLQNSASEEEDVRKLPVPAPWTPVQSSSHPASLARSHSAAASVSSSGLGYASSDEEDGLSTRTTALAGMLEAAKELLLGMGACVPHAPSSSIAPEDELAPAAAGMAADTADMGPGVAQVAAGVPAGAHALSSSMEPASRDVSGDSSGLVPAVSEVVSNSGSVSELHGDAGAEEGDWHDAVEEQYMEPLHTALHQAVHDTVQGAGADAHAPTAEAVVLEGLYAATEAVMGPLHMAPKQAMETLGGTSTLHMVQHAAHGPPSRPLSRASPATPLTRASPVTPLTSLSASASLPSHASSGVHAPAASSLHAASHGPSCSQHAVHDGACGPAKQPVVLPLPVLQLHGGKLRSDAAAQVKVHSAGRQPAQHGRHGQHSQEPQHGSHLPPRSSQQLQQGCHAMQHHSQAGHVPQQGLHSAPAGTSCAQGLPAVALRQQPCVPSPTVYTADIDVDAPVLPSCQAAQPCQTTYSATLPGGSGQQGTALVPAPAAGGAPTGDAAMHTVQLTACVGGQPVQLQLRLHFPQSCHAGNTDGNR